MLLKSIATHLPIALRCFVKYDLCLVGSKVYTNNVYHDMPPICIAILLQKYQRQGSLEHSQIKGRQTILKTTYPHSSKHSSTNNLLKLFLLVFCLFSWKRRVDLFHQFRTCLCKSCFYLAGVLKDLHIDCKHLRPERLLHAHHLCSVGNSCCERERERN